MKSCVGKRARTARRLMNGWASIEAGEEVQISSSNSRGMTITTDACPHCGIRLIMRRVVKSDLDLIDD